MYPAGPLWEPQKMIYRYSLIKQIGKFMNFLKTNFKPAAEIILFLAIYIFAYSGPVSGEITVKIPQTINLSAEDIKNRFPKDFKNKDFSVEILIYYFTDSVETLKFTEESGMSEYESDGTMKAILKIKKNNKTVKTVVIKSAGKNKDSIIKKMTGEINKILAEHNIN